MSLADDLIKSFRGDKDLKGLVHRGDDDVFHSDFLRTGLAPLDSILGGGFAYGRAIEIFGNYSSLKTYLLYLALAANQKAGGVSALAESEGAYDKEWFRNVGGNPDELLLFPVSTVEEVFTLMQKTAEFATSKPAIPFCFGWDSIAQTGTGHLLEKGMDKRDMTKAALMNQGGQLVTTLIKKVRMCVIATNQIREKIGSMDSSTHTPGGHAWKFFSSQRVECRFDGGSKTSLIQEMETTPDGKKVETKDPIGRWIRVEIEKNKCGPPKMWCSIPFYNDEGYAHPRFGYPTRIGVDHCEALFEFYLNSRFYLVRTSEAKERVIQKTSPGWYCLHPLLDPSGMKFRESDWPMILGALPRLWNLVYELPSTNTEQTDGSAEQSDVAASGVSEAQPGTVV